MKPSYYSSAMVCTLTQWNSITYDFCSLPCNVFQNFFTLEPRADYAYIPQIAISLTLSSDILKLPNLHLSFTLHFLDLVGKELSLILASKNPKDVLKKIRVSPSQCFILKQYEGYWRQRA
ncbi:UNVERIFIED_CONTAM: hypothetical protein NCL1_24192 [Trichonephila clavipes]